MPTAAPPTRPRQQPPLLLLLAARLRFPRCQTANTPAAEAQRVGQPRRLSLQSLVVLAAEASVVAGPARERLVAAA
jgi:hypothetical protein